MERKRDSNARHRPVGIYLDNCDGVVLEGNKFAGDMDAIVAKNSSNIRARDNTVVATQNAAELAALLIDVRAWARQAALNTVEGGALDEALSAATRESMSVQPSKTALRRSFEVILPILQGAAGNVVAQGLGTKILSWLARLD